MLLDKTIRDGTRMLVSRVENDFFTDKTTML